MTLQEQPTTDAGSLFGADLFDYIVVGGGTAGLVVASRLSEDPGLNILVVEAGADRRSDPRTFIPGLTIQTYDDEDFDWSYQTTPQQGLNGRRLHQTAGKGIGGSSSINLSMMSYPAASSFDSWETMGNSGWSWNDMIPYVRKFHVYNPPSEAVRELLGLEFMDEALHGTSGPIQTCFGEDIIANTPYNEAWPKAFEELNQAISKDRNAGISKGVFSNIGTIDPDTKQRSHAGNSYYTDEVAARPNLHLLTETTVAKIILGTDDDDTVVANGVEMITKDGQKFQLCARTEVIIAAGAVKSPQLLELSGIGSAALLKSQGIETIIDNPNVGENLQEHGFVPMNYEIADGQVPAESKVDGVDPVGACGTISSFMPVVDFATEAGHSYLEELFATHLESSDKECNGKAKQDGVLQKLLRDPENAPGQYSFTSFQIKPENGPSPKQIFSPGDGQQGQYISISSSLNHPFSRGSTHITSTDPLSPPELDTGLLSHPLDLELLARHLLWTEKLINTSPLSTLIKPPTNPPTTLASARETAKALTTPCFHLCGTCSMLPLSLGGVVDARLKVHGTKNLRIVDASIFPLIPRGNIQASVYAVAEKAADMIKEDIEDLREAGQVDELLESWRRDGLRPLRYIL